MTKLTMALFAGLMSVAVGAFAADDAMKKDKSSRSMSKSGDTSSMSKGGSASSSATTGGSATTTTTTTGTTTDTGRKRSRPARAMKG
jgi:hypothetical protein